MRKLYLMIRYYPYTSFALALAMLLCFMTWGHDSFALGCLVALVAVIMFLHNIPTWPKGFSRGELSKITVLNVIALLEEIGSNPTFQEIYPLKKSSSPNLV